MYSQNKRNKGKKSQSFVRKLLCNELSLNSFFHLSIPSMRKVDGGGGGGGKGE